MEKLRNTLLSKVLSSHLIGCLMIAFFIYENRIGAVEIRRLSVPRWVQNGTEDSIVLDCDYVYNEYDHRLVVKWFFDDNKDPVYQWIPELNQRYTSSMFRHRLDMDFAVNTTDAYSRFRALRIKRPSTELSGKYSCHVESLLNQHIREQVMTVYVPETDFNLNYTELEDSSVNVTCEAQGLYPSPVLKLFIRSPADSETGVETNPDVFSTETLMFGLYDAHLYKTFSASELSVHSTNAFECLLELPGTNYSRVKRIAYYSGVVGQHVGVGAVKIRRLSVPRWVQNGTEDSIVLDCDYVYNEHERSHLVVKWFFDDNQVPVYQWIPEFNIRNTYGMFQNRLDMDFAVNTSDAYSRFRALRIKKPSTELSGKYTCHVESLNGLDIREQVMTVYVPENDFNLNYTELADSSVNVTCEAQGLYPSPVLKLFIRSPADSETGVATNPDVSSTETLMSGLYDAHLHRTFSASELSVHSTNAFECLLELPGTNYSRGKIIAYYSGVDRLHIGAA